MTKISEDRLRALYNPIAQTRPASRQMCPSAEDIQALARREGDEEARLALLDHVMACAECRKEFDLLRAVEKAGRQFVAAEAPAQSSMKRFRASRLTWTLSAIAAAAVFAVGIQSYTAPAGSDVGVVRGVADPVTLVGPAADAVVDVRAEIRFVWNSVPRSERYELEVLDSAGRIIYRMTTTDTVAVFSDAAGKVDPSMPHRWWVRASMPSGEQQRSAMRGLRFSAE